MFIIKTGCVYDYIRDGEVAPTAYAVCRTVPAGYKGMRFVVPAPSASLLALWKKGKIDEEGYTKKYIKELNEKKDDILDGFQNIVNILEKDGHKEIILLCWEKEGQFCHRHILREWLIRNLGWYEKKSGAILKERIWHNANCLRDELKSWNEFLRSGLRTLPKVNCENCMYAVKNVDGMFQKCGHPLDPKGVYVPKTDTYNAYPWELGDNLRDPRTGDDYTEEAIRNLENREETEIRLLKYSLGRNEEGILRHDIRREYTAEVFRSRFPYLMVNGNRRDNDDWCIFHQFNVLLGKSFEKCLEGTEIAEALRDAYIMGPIEPEQMYMFRGRVPKFRKLKVDIEEKDGVEIRKYAPVRETGVYSIIQRRDGEEEVLVPNYWLTDTNRLFKAIFINNKGQNIFEKRISSLLYKGLSYSKAKNIVWEQFREFTPKILMDLAEHHTNWKRIPHPLNELALKGAIERLNELGVEIPKNAKPEDVFKTYRRITSQRENKTAVNSVELVDKEKLAELRGNVATTPKGTLIDKAAHDKYENTTYVVATKAGKMLAYQFNELPSKERDRLIEQVDEGEKKDFVFREDMGPLEAILNYDEESFIEWATENEKRAKKLLVDDFLEEIRFFYMEALPSLHGILYMVERAGMKERRCIICGKKLSKYNDGDKCFVCQEDE